MITAEEARLVGVKEAQKITKEEKEKIFLKKLKEINDSIKARSAEGFTWSVMGNKGAVAPVEKELTEALEKAGYTVSWCKYFYTSSPLYTISWEEI